MPHKLKIKGIHGAQIGSQAQAVAGEIGEMPRSSQEDSGDSQKKDRGAKDSQSKIQAMLAKGKAQDGKERARGRKLLDDEISKGDVKMRQALNAYLSVSESDNDNDKDDGRSKDDDDRDASRVGADGVEESKKRNSDSDEKRMSAVLYNGLISHSESSDEEDEDGAMDKMGERGAGDKEILDDDPDFMASDEPPDEFQSISVAASSVDNIDSQKEQSHNMFKKYMGLEDNRRHHQL